jgi:hypothetical protein
MGIQILVQKSLPLQSGFSAERILIFGYTDNVKKIIHNLEGRKQRIFIIADAEISDQENYKLAKKGVIYYSLDFLNMEAKDKEKLLKKIRSSKIQQIFLLEDSSVKNFSLYMELCAGAYNWGDDITCRCLCEDLGINKMIEDYYTTEVKAQKDEQKIQITLKVFSLAELKAVQLFTMETEEGQQAPQLYDYNLKEVEGKSRKEKAESKYWNVHMLLAGCGQLGQQVLYQTINQCVMHSESQVMIDIVDMDAAQIEDVIINKFNTDYLQEIPGQNGYCIKGDASDGELTIRFHALNTREKGFTKLLKLLEKDGLFTYVAICLNDSDLCIQCMDELENYFQKSITFQKRTRKPPIAVRLEMDQRTAKYLHENQGTYSNVVPFAENKKVLTLENIAKTETELKAQEYNWYYNCFYRQLPRNARDLVYRFVPQEMGDSERKKIRRSWKKLDYFLEESNRNACLHQAVKSEVLEVQYGPKWLEKIFGKKRGSELSIDIRKMAKDPMVRELLRIEHRRWNYAQASCGWGYPSGRQQFEGEKDPDTRLHKCMTNWDRLKTEHPDKCIYDLIPYLILYMEAKDKKGNSAHERSEHTTGKS